MAGTKTRKKIADAPPDPPPPLETLDGRYLENLFRAIGVETRDVTHVELRPPGTLVVEFLLRDAHNANYQAEGGGPAMGRIERNVLWTL